MNSPLNNPSDVLRFITAGNATVTIKSLKTETRFTYKVRKSEDGQVLFVSLLRGPDNEGDFAFMGVVRGHRLIHSRKSRVSEDALSFKAFDWFWRHVNADSLPPLLECWHEGKCGRCGRKLTVPESIARGIGPECWEYMS